MIETRNGDNDVLKQHAWGTRYVDELIQIGINTDPTDTEDNCEDFYYAAQDANYNVIGLVDQTTVKVWDVDHWDTDTVWTLVERYEYTPYGQRTVFRPTGVDDATTDDYGDQMCMAATLESQRVELTSSAIQPYGLCDIGHQGLMHDKEFGLIYNRARYLHPVLMRFMGRDREGYVDGRSLYEYVGSSPIGTVDPEDGMSTDDLPRGSSYTRPKNANSGIRKLAL